MTKYYFLLFALLLISCGMEKKLAEEQLETKGHKKYVTELTIEKTIKEIQLNFEVPDNIRIEKGVRQAAEFWRFEDGTESEFAEFCIQNFINSQEDLEKAFVTLQNNFEVLNGHFNKISLSLKFALHIDEGEVSPLDLMFGGYEPSSNMLTDLFKNKIAFYILLNFPHYSLDEKNTISKDWTPKQWAYARIGDIFSSRVPADLMMQFAELNNQCDHYIANYNIYMGNIIDPEGKAVFPADMKLISHWNLRDELKSNYKSESGLDKQRIIFNIMKRIINQEIPEDVINNPDIRWNPVSNKIADGEIEIESAREPDTRYKYLLDNFKQLSAMDAFNPFYPTYIDRKFNQDMEMPFEDVEKLFIELISSEQTKKVGNLIKQRLGRNLEPFDIWYDGFKSRNAIPDEDLSKITMAKYPDNKAFEKDLPNILFKLGFTSERSNYLADKILVDASRGAGHAWGAQMKGEKARLRSRIGKSGMDYKGYNIAMHEFGHNVEQTFSLYDVPEYMIAGVPNTAFTEAMAFIFQQRDLNVLGIKNPDPNAEFLHALDVFWSSYEIMGVALVDMYVWKWLYSNPKATPSQLREAVVSIAKDVWNKYYADVFGIRDQEILAIYSHMISYPLYLSAYPIGHLIEFQIEQKIKGKQFGTEIERMTTIGRVTPKDWMIKAVSEALSAKPVLAAVDDAINKLK
ncbi:MAG: hypothetical protein KIT33_01205 [Candidatus Kapabacteria bacterium]|nr:hypothetical protein [Ignavibacteriota bacterium]MCW5883566.1 hypothetical protein [Candidatus Kapabacteria bacterium]